MVLRLAITIVIGVLGTPAAGGGGGASGGSPDVLETILPSHRDDLGGVLADERRHRLQILYTQIDRDSNNRPHFRSFGHGLTEDYFYPASTVKLPAAILALEKLNDLAVPGLTRDTPLRIGVGAPGQTPVTSDSSLRRKTSMASMSR